MSNIFEASKTGNIRRIKELIQKPFFGFSSKWDVNITDPQGRTALYHAAENNHLETVKFLLQNKADANIQENTEKLSPLLATAEHNYVDITQELLKNKALVNIRTARGSTPLRRASFNGHLETVKLLLQHNADINLGSNNNSTPLYVSCQNGHLHVVSLLLENGADVNITRTDNVTPLFISCEKGHTDVVRMLLQNGADVNITTTDNVTPLYISCKKGHTDVVKLLLDHNADHAVARNDGWTPLSISSFNGHNDAVILLLQHQAVVDFRDLKQWTPLMLASQEGHVNVAQTLISYGAMVNATNHKGATALHVASQKGHSGILDMLLSNGASLESRDIYDNTALMCATLNNHLDCTKLLQSRGADIYASHYDVPKISDIGYQPKPLTDHNLEEDTYASSGYASSYHSSSSYASSRYTSSSYASSGYESSGNATSGVWKFPYQSGIYNIEKTGILVSIPESQGKSSGDLYITTGPVQDIEGVCDREDVLSSMITLLPHGSTFQNHILVVFPIIPTQVNAKNIQLIFSDSDYGKKMRWVSLQQHKSRVKHRDMFFWFIRDDRCFLFMRHFSHVFMANTSKLKQQDAIYATVSLHGLFRKRINENRYQLEFAVGFHCHECVPGLMQSDKIPGITLDSAKRIIYSEEGNISTEINVNIDADTWRQLGRNSNIFAPRSIMSLCYINDILSFGYKFISKGLHGIDTAKELTCNASVKQNEETVNFDVNTLLDFIAQDVTLNTDISQLSLLESTESLHKGNTMQGTTNSGNADSDVKSTTEITRPKDMKVEQTDSNPESSTEETSPKVHLQTDAAEISPPDHSLGATGFQAQPTVIQNMTQVNYNQYVIAPLPDHLSSLQGLPPVHKEGECIFNPSLYHEQTRLCELLDKDYERKLKNIVEEMKDINGTVDMKNITALVILQVWAVHVKSKDCTWRQFYDLLFKYNCKNAAQQLKVVYEKDRLLNKLDTLKHQLVMRDIVGQLVSKGVITLIEKDKLKQMHDSDAVEHLVQDLLLKRPHDCILNFHRVLYSNRYFKQYIQELMLCPEDIKSEI